ncbi:DUF1365 family protein [Billgrantia gudaonensis]|uniref:DUF1365 family protein n=1 Tax=Billgrantia gudaonensis TaxID=376427 RepID=A0A3S0QS99_9GAMM|nr:DUF1365 family protein [Halomonas gudaonensis]
MRHRRFVPRHHAFRYRLWMLWLDLDELPSLFDGFPASGPTPCIGPLPSRGSFQGSRTVQRLTIDRWPSGPRGGGRTAGQRPTGACACSPTAHVRLGLQPTVAVLPRTMRPGGLRAVLGEVTNTPGRTRLLRLSVNQRHSHASTFVKRMHVSPFLPMDMTYRWCFNAPGDRLLMHMENWRDAERHFDATLTLTGEPATRTALLGALARQPAMNLATRLASTGRRCACGWRRADP